MISKKIEKAIEALVEPIITQNGYEYVGTELKRAGGEAELIIYADKPGGLGLDDCETISRLIDPVIEEKDPIEESYYLCVSSPGLDRPLKEPRDFARSIGKIIDVKLYRPDEHGQKEYTGVLSLFDEQRFVLEGGKEFTHKDVAIVRLHVDI